MKKAFLGFTLAELLIALAILGVIATFTIPKVLHSQENDKKKAVIRETIGALNDITYQAVMKRDGLDDNTFYTYFENRLNYTIACPNAVATEGCWTQAFNTPNTTDYQGFKLHNGASLSSFTVCCVYGTGQEGNVVSIDWNGEEAPNTYGDDQFEVMVSWGTRPISGVYRPGTVLPLQSEPLSVAVFENAFQ